ncbi:hypothetical protein HO133_009419 [Letharia lupina]|uniref:Mitochondrial distribution and morphology protein 12 n=1 Tax=Letharia lupina TaxID=560253 RepID=A0A8H6CN85_9LECA|nr:uncharacterized protein HO133_009419 [Letharia lupina]KAF6226553.1 hypothetical protein HO133_009419 [Letharia lupina]
MSITIDWASLTTGPAGLALADSIRDFIHDKFQQVALPRFIRSVQVHSFDFGEEGPEVELKDISDPFPEFYEDDGDDDDDDDEEEEEAAESSEGEEAVSGAIVAAPASTAPKPPTDAPNRAPTTVPPPAIDPRPPNPTLRAGFPFPPPPADQISTPFLSRSSTPGLPIPGGTANFGYFHLPLGAGLSGTQTPLLPWGEQQQQQQQRPPSPLRRERGHGAAFGPAVPRGESNTPRRRRDQRSPSRGSYTAGPAEPDGGGGDPTTTTEDRSQDLQTTLHISYSGTVALSLTAEILLDYPMPSFVGIPLQLRITGLSFDGVAVLAYLRHPGAVGDAERRKVHFCFLGREDAKATVGDEGGVGDGGEEGPGGLLREIRVESEIGRQEGGKQVLKNVGKVEKFVLEQVRRIFEDEFVWPSFWTFLV